MIIWNTRIHLVLNLPTDKQGKSSENKMGAKISLYTVTKAISVSNNFTVFNIPTLHCYMCKSTVQKVLDKQSMVPLRLKTFGDI